MAPNLDSPGRPTVTDDRSTLDPDLEERLRAVVDAPTICEMVLDNKTPCTRPAVDLRVPRPCGHSVASCAECDGVWRRSFEEALRKIPGLKLVYNWNHPITSIDWLPL